MDKGKTNGEEVDIQHEREVARVRVGVERERGDLIFHQC